MSHKRIDVHHHLIPPPYLKELDRLGIKDSGGKALPKWSPKDSIDVMDANYIQLAILSLSTPGVYFGNRADTEKLARVCNEYAKEVCEQNPSRFGFFAVLPMPFTDAATKEAIYALDHLGAQGVILLANTDGKYLGQPEFEELMAELNKRSAIVFVHPNTPPDTDKLGLNEPAFLIEFLCDTTRAAVNLILKGVMERHSNIKWILAHSGGFLPYAAWRVALANGMPEFIRHVPHGVMHYIKQFYFDTALSPSPYSLASLKELVDPSHILFGSDFPFAPAALVNVETQTLDQSTVFEKATSDQFRNSNALALFPELKIRADFSTDADKDRSIRQRATSGLVQRIISR
jgi:6-methylsalicylate decarboxylase